MPAAALLIPLAIQAGGAIAAHYAGKSAQNADMQRSPEELANLASAQGAAGNLGTTGTALSGMGVGNMGQAGNYYSTLLSGNRAAMANATAGQRVGIQDQIRGSQAQLTASGLRGAARDQAAGNIMRQGGSAISGLTTGVQPWAANQLGALGGQEGQLGNQASNASGNIYGNLLQLGQNNRQNAQQAGAQTAAGVMTLANNAANTVSGYYANKNASNFKGLQPGGAAQPVSPFTIPSGYSSVGPAPISFPNWPLSAKSMNSTSGMP